MTGATAHGRWAIPVGLFVAVLLSRLPFVTHQLWAWDSVLYARALENGFHVDFDLADQRPQPPGYLLYLAAAAVARMFVGGSNAALVTVSVVASALGAVAVHQLARRFAGHGASLFVAAGFAANPLVWTYGEVAYPYAVLGLLSVALAGAFWVVRPGPVPRVLLASFAFGLLAGFRQDILLLLGGLWLWLVWPRSWRVRSVAASLVTIGALCWFIPTALLSEGVEVYLRVLGQQGDAVRSSYSVAAQGSSAFGYNLAFTVYALAWGLVTFGPVLAVLGLGAAVRAGRAVLVERRSPSRKVPPQGTGQRASLAPTGRTFFLAWLAPGLAFYVAVHIGEWGYVLSVLPALYVVTAALLARPLGTLAVPRAAWAVLATLIALAPAGLFVLGGDRFSAAALAHHDRAIAARVAYVREHFPPDRTILLTREDYLTVRYYLPEYRAWLYDPEPYHNAARRKRATHATTLVIFTEGLTPRQNLDVRSVQALPGIPITYVTIEAGAVLEFYRDGFQVREP